MRSFRNGEAGAQESSAKLEIELSQFYELYSSYLKACAKQEVDTWEPGVSGGDHWPALSEEIQQLLSRLFAARPPSTYAGAAAEIHRRFHRKTSASAIRRWALTQGVAPYPPRRAPAAVRRWQCQKTGALWQLDASPHKWFGEQTPNYPLLDMLDDCSRVNVGARLYERETLPAYLDFLSHVFEKYGLPLEIYVDYHSFFWTKIPQALTQLSAALRFYDISFRYASTPQAKGKIERRHFYWQNRLPPVLVADQTRCFDQANKTLEEMRIYGNEHERHSEIQRTPNEAWEQAKKEKRNVLRPKPRCPWWPYVWSVQTSVRVQDNGKVPIGSQHYRLGVPPRSKVILCTHTNGSYTVLRSAPDHSSRPEILLHLPASR